MKKKQHLHGKAVLYKMQPVRDSKVFKPWKSVPEERLIPATLTDFITSDKKKKIGMEYWVKAPNGNQYYCHEFNDHVSSESFQSLINQNMLYLLKND